MCVGPAHMSLHPPCASASLVHRLFALRSGVSAEQLMAVRGLFNDASTVYTGIMMLTNVRCQHYAEHQQLQTALDLKLLIAILTTSQSNHVIEKLQRIHHPHSFETSTQRCLQQPNVCPKLLLPNASSDLLAEVDAD
jgi:hypothetical protein